MGIISRPPNEGLAYLAVEQADSLQAIWTEYVIWSIRLTKAAPCCNMGELYDWLEAQLPNYKDCIGVSLADWNRNA